MRAEDIKQWVGPVLAGHDLFLVEMKISKDNVIEVFVDSAKGVNIQTCIEVSREIENKLNRDEEDFELTVSSAGIGYPFKVEGQYRKNIGNTVEIKGKDNKKITGILLGFDEENIRISYEEKKAIEGSKKKQMVTTEISIPREEIKEIRDVVNFK